MENLREERTFLLIKSDGVQRGLIGEIIGRLEQRDLKVIALQMFQPTFEEMNKHYPQDSEWITRLGKKMLAGYAEANLDVTIHLGTDDPALLGASVREQLVEYMVSAPLVKMIVQGAHAVDMVRKIVGPTMPFKAEMGTIRGDYSNDSSVIASRENRAVYNIVHASETPKEAEHEIDHWFGNFKGFEYSRR